jgi:hypothetical protein
LDEGLWSSVFVSGLAPLPKVGFSIAGNQSEHICQIYVLGGKLRDGTYDYTMNVLEEGDSSNVRLEQQQSSLAMKGSNERLVVGERELISNAIGGGGSSSVIGMMNDSGVLNQEIGKGMKINELAGDAEKVMGEQKKQIEELEVKLKKMREEKVLKIEMKEKIEKKVHDVQHENEIRVKEVMQRIEEKKKRNMQNNELLEQLKRLACLEKKRRKLLDSKVTMLQNIMKGNEKLLISSDAAINFCLQSDVFDGVIGDELLEKLTEMKIDHKNSLSLFKESFDAILKKEESIRHGTKDQKIFLKTHLSDLKEMFYSNVSEDEQRLFKINPIV